MKLFVNNSSLENFPPEKQLKLVFNNRIHPLDLQEVTVGLVQFHKAQRDSDGAKVLFFKHIINVIDEGSKLPSSRILRN